ncbi:MAG: aminotransferase class V-fold PLP-dependent enzyme [Acidimicrobiales bacterium]
MLLHVERPSRSAWRADRLRRPGHRPALVQRPQAGRPAGTGGLLVRRGLRIDPLLVGGDQGEPAGRPRTGGGARRPGRRRRRLASSWAEEVDRAVRLTERIRAAAAIEGVEAYGHPTERLPHLVCLGIAGVEPQGVLLGLGRAGVAAHSGSACSSESLEPSPVLEAMGVDAHRSLRLSVGWSTTDEDVDLLVGSLDVTIDRLRALAAGEAGATG